MNYKTILMIIWGYVVEIIGAGTLYGITVLCVGISPLTRFMQDTADDGMKVA
jgi:Na+-transporting NADH:ubiquinone oxidoreductase subunit NqrD